MSKDNQNQLVRWEKVVKPVALGLLISKTKCNALWWTEQEDGSRR